MKSISAGSKALVFAALLIVAGCGEVRSREDFVALVKDKSPTEVQAKLGKPVEVDESVAGTIRWTYKAKTFHTESGTHFDKKTVVVFKKTDAAGAPHMVDVVYE